MKDQYNREIDYLRVSVTDRCNLRCVYCMPEEGVEPVAHEEILSYEEILRVCRCAAKLGFWRVKLTGGEPLVRRGVAGLAREIKAIPGIRQVTMTTNGVLLGDYAEELAAAGLDAVNVSLDTLDPEAFHRITRRGELSRVLDSIDRRSRRACGSSSTACPPGGTTRWSGSRRSPSTARSTYGSSS